MVGSMGKAGRSIVIAQNYWRGKCRFNRTKWERREVIWQRGSLISRQMFIPEDHVKLHCLQRLELVTPGVFSALIFMGQMTPVFGNNWRRSVLCGELCFLRDCPVQGKLGACLRLPCQLLHLGNSPELYPGCPAWKRKQISPWQWLLLALEIGWYK